MTPAEQTAFVDEYCVNIGTVPRDTVADFMRQFSAGTLPEYDPNQLGIADALLMWNSAIRWHLTQ